MLPTLEANTKYKTILSLHGNGEHKELMKEVQATMEICAIMKILGKFFHKYINDNAGPAKLREHAQKMVKDLRTHFPGQDKPEKHVCGPGMYTKVQAMLSLKA